MAYHPNKSKLSVDKLADYLRAPVQDHITSGVAIGVGPETIQAFAKEGINSGFQLHAKFLSFRDPGMDPKVHVESFYQWLCLAQPSPNHRAGLTHAVAEKCNLMYPGIYDVSAYKDP